MMFLPWVWQWIQHQCHDQLDKDSKASAAQKEDGSRTTGYNKKRSSECSSINQDITIYCDINH
jgi:hypothetical protein